MNSKIPVRYGVNFPLVATYKKLAGTSIPLPIHSIQSPCLPSLLILPGRRFLSQGKVPFYQLPYICFIYFSGSGFLASWTVKTLLENGFSVRTTVRSPPKADSLKKTFADHARHLEFSYVKDIAEPNAFDEAVQGIDAVIHCASPLPADDPKAEPSVNIIPAIQGTLGILKSSMKVPGIQRVVITSSVGAVNEPHPPTYEYTEVKIAHLSWYPF